jgi:glycerophosphoryl diester phosphodiesterase
VLIARHENEISETTDVALKFPSRKKTKLIDGEKKSGWFTEDFTIKEIKSLRAKERLPYRSQKENGKYEVPTFIEVLRLVQEESKLRGRSIGIAPELKHSTYFKAIGLPLEDRFVDVIQQNAAAVADTDAKKMPIMVQSFEVANLKYLRNQLSRLTNLQIEYVQLLDDPEKTPYDQVGKPGAKTYLAMASLQGLEEIKKYAYWVSPHKSYIGVISADNRTLRPTGFVEAAHKVGLKVLPYTFRSDKENLSPFYKGGAREEYLFFMQQNIDGLFTDFPDHAIAARKEYQSLCR